MSKSRKAARRRQAIRSSAANRTTAVTLAPSPWDHGAAGQANRIGLVEEERGEKDPKTGKVTNPNGVTGVRRYDMLEVYHKRGWISTAGFNAGEMFREAWLRTGIGTCAPWLRERVDSSPKPDAAVAIQIDRMSALIKISRMVPQDDQRILECVCAHGDAIGRLPEYRGRKHEDGKAHLREALDRLSNNMQGLRGNLAGGIT